VGQPSVRFSRQFRVVLYLPFGRYAQLTNSLQSELTRRFGLSTWEWYENWERFGGEGMGQLECAVKRDFCVFVPAGSCIREKCDVMWPYVLCGPLAQRRGDSRPEIFFRGKLKCLPCFMFRPLGPLPLGVKLYTLLIL